MHSYYPMPHHAMDAYADVQLGRLNDAAMLLRECGRHDLLNKLYQVIVVV